MAALHIEIAGLVRYGFNVLTAAQLVGTTAEQVRTLLMVFTTKTSSVGEHRRLDSPENVNTDLLLVVHRALVRLKAKRPHNVRQNNDEIWRVVNLTLQ